MYCKLQYKLDVFNLLLMCSWDDWFLIDFWLILASKIDEKSMKNRSKKRSKIRCDLGWILDGSWSDLGAIWGPSWGPSWGQVGTKIRKMGAPRRCQKMCCKKLVRVYASVCGCMRAGRRGSPIINQSNTPRTTPWALEHSPRAQGPVADIYHVYLLCISTMYIYYVSLFCVYTIYAWFLSTMYTYNVYLLCISTMCN